MADININNVDYDIFSTNYGVCFECYWETDRDMSDDQIREAMKDHWIEDHPWCMADQEIYMDDTDILD